MSCKIAQGMNKKSVSRRGGYFCSFDDSWAASGQKAAAAAAAGCAVSRQLEELLLLPRFLQ